MTEPELNLGETKQFISARVWKHIRHTKNENTDKSAIVEHSYNTKHGIQFDKKKVLAKDSHYHSRIIRETIRNNQE